MSYLRAVLSSDIKKEEKYLKELISVGKKLQYNTTKYQNELKKIHSKKTIVKKNLLKKASVKKSVKKTSTYNKSKYTIKSVYTKNNTIVVTFNKHINNKYLTFFELHYKKLSKDVFDIKGNFKDAKPSKLSINGIDRISIAQNKKDILRIVLSHKTNLKTTYSFNKKSIIIKIHNLSKKRISPSISKIIKNKYYVNKNKVIVIDAGHGGKDSGAVGPYKRYEKHSVLKVSKYLYSYLKQEGYKVYLTRNKDKFIKVNNRTILANRKKADIFISVHANSVPKSKAHRISGIETFFLSPARSERAKRVAAKENRSDLRKMNYSSKNSFLTVLNRSKITASQKLAIDVQKNILHNLRKSYKKVNDSGVREGPFWVLVGAQMPSILVEIGYMSHPLESKRLYSSAYQKKIAKGIANGVNAYFAKNP